MQRQARAMTAEVYLALDRTTEVDKVEVEFQNIINAQPTQIHPHEREAFLKAILSDLADEESAPWTTWQPSLYLTCLTAVKCLARNPVGSTSIISNLRTLLHHTSLPLPPPASPFSHPPNEPEHPTSLEALKILANALVLHDAAGRIFAEIGGGKAVAKALKGDISVERLFLLGRIGFLVSLNRREVVRQMVDKERLVESLVLHLNTTAPVSANFAALSELLKMTNNIVRFYPTPLEEWSPKLDPLILPTLNLFHSIPFDDIAPPLSNTIHVLLSIPFTPELLGTWSRAPPPAPTTSSPPTTLDKLSSLLIGQPRRSTDSIRESISLSPPTNYPHGHDQGPRGRRSPSPTATRVQDATVFPARLLKILEGFFERYLPYPKDPDDELPHGLILDDILPPVLALLVRAVGGSQEIKGFVRKTILPPSLDRSPEAGALEKRPGILGNLLRLMNAASHISSRDTAGELLWAVCDSHPSTFTSEIGYGNAAGLLFRKGLSGPPPAKIEEIQDLDPTPPDRHPITSLAPPTAGSEPPNPLDGMTDEEKEREAEKLFVLFDRMEKNPVISMTSGAGEGEGEKTKTKTPRELMREKLAKGELEGQDDIEAKEREEEEKRDEEEAMADLRRYKERMGRK